MSLSTALGGLLLTLAGAPPPVRPVVAPMVVVVSTSRGDRPVPVRLDPIAGPVLPAPLLLASLGGRSTVGQGWALVEVAHQPFRFLLGAPVYTLGDLLRPLVGAASVRRDTLFLPLQFVTYLLPFHLRERFRYEPESARLVELGTRPSGPDLTASREPGRVKNGLGKGHVVTIDAGHGGVDPGNPGKFFPRGLKEKHITLQLALLVRSELQKRGVGVVMTRSTDTLINLRHRAGYCTSDCDLFASIHVNSIARRPGYTEVRGFETYFLAEGQTEDAARVAKMENEAVRFEVPDENDPSEGLDFIIKDLQLNEYLRESARLAELVQSHLEEVHTGPNQGVKQEVFTVLTTARRPAVLIEVGYSTNPSDARLMSEPRSQRNLAASMADAIVAYLLEYERRTAVVGSAPTGPKSP